VRAARRLTRRIRAGDHDAFATLYRARFDMVLALARRTTRRDEAFCLDVTQEVFLRVIRAIPQLHDERALDAWLTRCAITRSIDALRRTTRRARRDADHQPPNTTDPGNDPEDLAWLRGRIDALPDRDRALLEARLRFGWTVRRIGAAFGLTAPAAAGSIARTIERLRLEAEHQRHDT